MAEPSLGAFRRAADLRTETYRPSHPAVDAPAGQRGQGALTGTWIACEEPGAAEGWLASDIKLVMDARLEPNAIIGRHEHPDTEELYIVLEGRLTVTAAAGQRELVSTLAPGDVHRIGPGGWHTARAGSLGARIMVIAAQVRP